MTPVDSARSSKYSASVNAAGTGEKIAGNQKAKVIEEAIEAKDGKTETEDIGELHD
jgi:hypothetical protein